MEDSTNQIQDLQNKIKEISMKSFPDHFHNGNDFSRVEFKDINRKKIWIHHTIQGLDAATATNYGVFFISPISCTLLRFQEVHQTLGTDAGSVTLQLEKLTGTQAPDSGVNMLKTALSLKTANNTVQSGVVSTTLADTNLVSGDRLCMKDSGVLTALANLTVMVELQIN